MVLEVLGSSSLGNCYILKNKEEVLLIEAGLPIKHINKALGFNFDNVVGCIVSHKHGDHSMALDKLDGLINIYTNKDTAISKNLRNYSLIEHMKLMNIGGFKIIPFELNHDVECHGFFIEHKDMGRLVFITDSAYCDYKFVDVNHIMVECNFDYTSLNKAIDNGKTPSFQKNRLIGTHMELQETISVIKNNKSDMLDNVLLLHLSPRNSDEKIMISSIQKELGITPTVAKDNLVMNLTKTPY